MNLLKRILYLRLRPSSVFLIAAFFFQSAFARSNEEQMLSRITALWKDKQTHLVKAQAQSFFESYPNSTQAHLVQMALAYAYREEGNFKLAKEALIAIGEPHQNEETNLLLIDCLYQLKDYDEVILACRSSLEKSPKEKKLLYGYLGLSLLQKSKQSAKTSTDLDVSELRAALHALDESSSSNLSQTISRSKVEILRLLKEHKKACALARELSVSDPENSDSLLFIAALESAHFDTHLSLELFEKISHDNNKLAPLAAYNWMVGLVREKRFKDFIDKRAAIKKNLSKKNIPLFTFYLAEASFHIQDFSKALRLLEEVTDKLEDPMKKRSLVLMAFCADKTNNARILKKIAHQLIASYPTDESTLDVVILHARQCQKEGLFEEAKSALDNALQKKSPLQKRASLELFSLCLEYQMDHFGEVLHKGLKFFDPKAHDASDAKAFLELMASAALKLRSRAALDNLDALLEKAQASSVKLPITFSLGYVELLLENRNPIKACTFLEKEIQNREAYSQSDISELYEALGKTYSLENDPQKRSHFLELALKESGHKNSEKKLPIYLDLFNAYRKLYISAKSLDEWHEKAGKPPLELAANILFGAFQIDSQRLSTQNKQWLAELYFEEVEKAFKTHFKAPLPETAFMRSYDLYKELIKETSCEESILAKNLMHLAKLIMFHNKRSSALSSSSSAVNTSATEALIFLKEAIRLIENSDTPKAPLIQSSILVDMGQCFEQDLSYAEAKKSYSQAIEIAKLSKPADLARLYLCRLKLKEGTSNLNEVIATLKDLQLKKSLDHEPLFLEAAIDYIDASCLGLEPSVRDEKKLFLLERMEEDFWNDVGAVHAHYHKKRQELPDQDKIFLAYMQYVELHLQFLKAKKLEKNTDSLEALRNVKLEVTKSIVQLTSHTEYLEIKTHLLLGLIDDIIH